VKEIMDSGLGLVIFALIVVPLIALFVYSVVKDNRETSARLAEQMARRPPAPVTSVAPATSASVPQASGTNPAVAWNIVVIVAGVFIAVIGLINGLTSNPDNSAFRQTVGALWVIQGLLGLLIAAIGILGAGVVYTISRLPRNDQAAL
jgi:hypothetical protein